MHKHVIHNEAMKQPINYVLKILLSTCRVATTGVFLCLFPSVVFAQDNTEDNVTDTTVTEVNQALEYFTNTRLVNQHGKEVLFYQDLLKDKTVVINVFFTESNGVCAAVNRNMEQIQVHFTEIMGKELHLISITVDPTNDVPEVLTEYAQSYNAANGWHFLSGEVENVRNVLRKVGKDVEERESHDSVLLVGNLSTNLWKKANGLSDIEEIIKIVESVVSDGK
ncbi:SCO family protein [Maribacter antarcticus]|uniref:SCO family protein n=1 Tax=Maribacter antarcticus TaxID=505250 RepID=UPI00047E0E4D|nr:SCO family protein [Maribacter antarcticus]